MENILHNSTVRARQKSLRLTLNTDPTCCQRLRSYHHMPYKFNYYYYYYYYAFATQTAEENNYKF